MRHMKKVISGGTDCVPEAFDVRAVNCVTHMPRNPCIKFGAFLNKSLRNIYVHRKMTTQQFNAESAFF